jgi:hypothetical protein
MYAVSKKDETLAAEIQAVNNGQVVKMTEQARRDHRGVCVRRLRFEILAERQRSLP